MELIEKVQDDGHSGIVHAEIFLQLANEKGAGYVFLIEARGILIGRVNPRVGDKA